MLEDIYAHRHINTLKNTLDHECTYNILLFENVFAMVETLSVY